MNKDTSNIIQGIFSCNIKCKDCGGVGTFKAVMLNEGTCPSKLNLINQCTHCKTHEVSEHEVFCNNYGLEITCHFLGKNDLNRWIYLNAGSEIKLFDSKELVCETKSDNSCIDTLETLLMRIKDCKERQFNNGEGIPLDSELSLNKDLKLLSEFIETGVFSMTILDPSGYSRVCPIGKEYKEIAKTDICKLNENGVIYEKTQK